jgi:hypothetical protein
MKTLVLSVSFFVLTMSPFTCSTDMTEVVNAQNENTTTDNSDYEEENVEIDPIIMPTKP